jgi:hypothetical protein
MWSNGVLCSIIGIMVILRLIKRKLYWLGWDLDKPQTWWAKAIDYYTIWLNQFNAETLIMTGFILGMTLALLLSISNKEK